MTIRKYQIKQCEYNIYIKKICTEHRIIDTYTYIYFFDLFIVIVSQSHTYKHTPKRLPVLQ